MAISVINRRIFHNPMTNSALQSLFELLRNRRSIRVFKKKGINSKDILKRILEACDMAPSSGDLQTYEIYYVKNHTTRKKLVSAAHNQEFLAGGAASSGILRSISLSSQIWQEVPAVLCSGCNYSSCLCATYNIRIRSYDCMDRGIRRKESIRDIETSKRTQTGCYASYRLSQWIPRRKDDKRAKRLAAHDKIESLWK
jgi:hypothetical protein